MFGLSLFLTYYLQQVKGFSPVQSGLAYLPMVAGIVTMSNVSSLFLLPKFGPRRVIPVGMVLGTIGMLGLARIEPTSSYVGVVLPSLILIGLAMGMIVAPSMNTATIGVVPADAGVASALVNTMQQVGGSVGTSVLSTVVASATASYLVGHPNDPVAAASHGYSIAFLAAALVFAVGAVACNHDVAGSPCAAPGGRTDQRRGCCGNRLTIQGRRISIPSAHSSNSSTATSLDIASNAGPVHLVGRARSST